MEGDNAASDILSRFVHRFIPSRSGSSNNSTTLLLLHGTGGNEDELIPLGSEIAPDCAILSPRGKVLENGMPRFFKRLAEGVFDIQDLKFRTGELADFVTSASKHYNFDLKSVVAVGYSNGANIGASMLLLHADVLSGAVLFRGMLPFVPEKLPHLSGKSILLLACTSDPLIPRLKVEELEKVFQKSGANVTLNWAPTGHALMKNEIRLATDFFQEQFL